MHTERTSPTDLEVTGLLEGLADGESRFIKHEDLLALPTQDLDVEMEFWPGELRFCRILFLSELKKVLPLKDETDVLIVHCKDSYYSFFTRELVSEYHPFIVLQIDGKSPPDWPRTASGLDFGPYYVTASTEIAPHFEDLFYFPSKEPWGGVRIEAANYAKTFKPIYSGRFANLNAQQARGRYIYMNNCMNCHQWEDNSFGGNVGERNFVVLASHARYNKEYFFKYTKNPTQANPASKMSPNPHLTKAELEALRSFMSLYFP
ncbi:MAG: c-type cytochrome [Opitutales bacterium]